MEPADFFSIKSVLSPEERHVYQNLFNRDRTKNFEIKQKEETKSFHNIVLDDNEFKETLYLFPNNRLEIPGELDFKMIDHILNYLYFKEIKEIPDEDLFPLLEVATFMKIHPVVIKIKEFLEKPVISCQRAVFFFKEVFKFECQQIENNEFLMKAIENSSFCLLENRQIDTFLNFFDQDFLKKIENHEKFWFDFFFERVLKKIQASNEFFAKFAEIFKDGLLLLNKQEEPNLNPTIMLQNLQIMYIKLSTEMNNLRESNEIMRKQLDEVIAKNEKNNQPTEESVVQSKLKTKLRSLTHRFTLLKKKVDQKFKEKKEQNLEENSSKLILEDETSQEEEILEEESSNKNFIKTKNTQNILQNQKPKSSNISRKDETSEQISPEEGILDTSSLEQKGEYIKSLEIQKKKIDRRIRFEKFGYWFFKKGLEQYFKFTNSFKTVQKISDDEKRFGVRCRSVYFNEVKPSLTFSINIEHTENAQIFFGFTLKNTSFNGGFYNKKTSFMLNLRNGRLHNRSKRQYIRGGMKKKGPAKNDDRYTAILDFKNQTISFLLDGESFGGAKQINISEEEYAKLVPCVDLQQKSDKITIID